MYDGGDDQLTMKFSKTQGYFVASRPIFIRSGTGSPERIVHAWVRQRLAYT